jgi:hypothetical protein
MKAYNGTGFSKFVHPIRFKERESGKLNLANQAPRTAIEQLLPPVAFSQLEVVVFYFCFVL